MVLGKVESNQREGGGCFKLSSSSLCKRGRRVIVASGPAIDAPVISNEPLTKDDLIHYMVSGCKPKEEWRYKINHSICIHTLVIFAKYYFIFQML
jgi:glutamate--cysteine ligase